MGVTQSQWTWHFCSQHTTSKPKGSETRNPSAIMAVSLGQQRCTTCGLWPLKGAGSWLRCHQVTTGRPRTCKSATRQHSVATCLKACFYGRRQKAAWKAGKFLHCFWACDDGSDGYFGKHLHVVPVIPHLAGASLAFWRALRITASLLHCLLSRGHRQDAHHFQIEDVRQVQDLYLPVLARDKWFIC